MFLLRYVDKDTARTHELQPGLTVLGRMPSCDIVLNDPSVSRHHASVRIADGTAAVADIGSRYGTYLNGRRVKEEVPFAPGDELQLGELKLVLERHVPEQDLLTEDHDVSEGPGTICLPTATILDQASPQNGRLLRLIADVGRTLLGSQALSEVLDHVVDLAFTAVPAERAFLMLRESSDQALAARVLRHRDGTVPANATLSRQVVRKVMRERVAMLAADATTDPGIGVSESILRFSIRSFMCAPLWSQDEIIGVLYVDSPRIDQFTATDLDAFTALSNAAAIAIEQARLASQLLAEQRRRERLQRYHSPAVVSRIIASDDEAGLVAQERDVSIMFCDLVGFTTLCEHIAPTESASLLNQFLTEMTDVVFEYEGTLDKFLGDALLAVFGAPFEQPDHPLKAVQAAIGMRRALQAMNARPGARPLQMRIAINTGMAVTGDIGSPRRREFTVLGDTVNTASRIEDEVAGPGQIVIAGSTRERLDGKIQVRPIGARLLRGRTNPLECFEVLD